MAYYHRLGELPPKRHIQFRQPDGSLYKEELVSSKGFSGIYSNLYHIYNPNSVKSIGKPVPFDWDIAKEYGLKQTHLNTSKISTTGKDYLNARKMLLKNNDVMMGICVPEERKMDYYFKNADGDELIYVHDGEGYMYSQFGKLKVSKGDYIVIPRTTIYRFEWNEGPLRLLVIESHGPIETVKRYRNEVGQLLEHSPYCERDIHPPTELHIEKEKGDYLVQIKKQGMLHQYSYEHSPLDIVGWDGYLYPYTMSIHDFEPITGRIHQPPPVHQTFQAWGFVICSFVPRLFDYHPQSIPAPYNHSNIDSDEVLYYAEGEFMSRKGIDRGSFTLHMGGLPHGPHPGTVEKSLGAEKTEEYAVMLDTFRPLFVTTAALDYVDKDYPMSWTE
ncbi:homogentisate 1,2-dioxygenase [Litoribacter ruber]|uniref:Homogentisate 1,2-dioxygenase n=1 Tax=Litoribacter ruber TaxID=702568 RepID=A0AAP2CGN3_9BACT|nr:MULTISPECIES: homogentisate 1,2-dioxygenase [Litoribacter]MBS9524281.1 homogentisate 1,2-dioxygenase [Litoribacter alkaliphilus]MBT0809921.1 homogentisate 1,2-dioxygenase [Litoribacter ruber]